MRKRRHSQLTGLILDIQMFTSRMQVYCSVSAPVALFSLAAAKWIYLDMMGLYSSRNEPECF